MINVQEILSKDRLLFYDIECFKEDSLVVFKNYDGETVKIFHNDFNGMYDLIKGKTLVGYNSYWYDDPMLEKMLACWSPKQLKEHNDRLISGQKVKIYRLGSEIITLDCFQQIDVSKPSLKKVEANMGSNIYESLIDFTLDRKLTEEELEETIHYFSYDVQMTIEIFKKRINDYFEHKINIVAMLDEPIQKRAIRWNTTTISANLVTNGRPLQQWSDIRLGPYDESGEYEMFSLVPKQVEAFWRENVAKDKGKFVLEEFGCKIEFGFGGLHGTPIRNKVRYNKVKMLDVAL